MMIRPQHKRVSNITTASTQDCNNNRNSGNNKMNHYRVPVIIPPNPACTERDQHRRTADNVFGSMCFLLLFAYVLQRHCNYVHIAQRACYGCPFMAKNYFWENRFFFSLFFLTEFNTFWAEYCTMIQCFKTVSPLTFATQLRGWVPCTQKLRSQSAENPELSKIPSVRPGVDPYCVYCRRGFLLEVCLSGSFGFIFSKSSSVK